jgi:hypothetical protein
MEPTSHHPEIVNAARLAALEKHGSAYVSRDRETRAGVETDCAAFHLNREPQTLRVC